MKYIKLTSIFLLVIMAKTFLGTEPPDGDGQETNIIPPSPTAYELGKYGQIPVGHFTGTPNVSVPIYNYQAGQLTLPISLSYNSNGIKVNQYPSNVGLGWSLNCGGVITRIIKDEPDEWGNSLYPEQQLGSGTLYTAQKMEFVMASIEEGVDTEADLFMFNFTGYSGKFIYTNKKQIVAVPYQNINIEPVAENTGYPGYVITTPDGIKYTFDTVEMNNSIASLKGFIGDNKFFKPASWYLTKITHPSGDEIYLEYEKLVYEYKSSIIHNYKKTTDIFNNCSSGTGGCPNYNNFTEYDITNKTIGKKIIRISSNNPNFGTVEFKYYDNNALPGAPNKYIVKDILVQNSKGETKKSYNLNYLSTANNRIFLQKVQFLDPHKNYQFEYNDAEGLCERLSHSQDHWGYFNNANNAYLLPVIKDHDAFVHNDKTGNREPNHTYAQKGLLKKVTYPTKGSSLFEYEANTYSDDVEVCPNEYTLNLSVSAEREAEGFVTDTEQTLLVTHSQEKIRLGITLSGGSCWNPITSDSTRMKAEISILNLTTGEYAKIWLKSTGAWPWILQNNPFDCTYDNSIRNQYFVDLEEGGVYEVTIKPFWFCVSASANFDYEHRPDPCYSEEQNIVTGGSRIKRITNYDPVSNKNNITRYYYNKFDGDYDKLNVSSGNPGPTIKYVTERLTKINCSELGGTLDCSYYELSSNTVIPLYNTGNNSIYYPFVTVSYGGDYFENGGETHEYALHRDVQGRVIKGSQPHLSASHWVNEGWEHGLELNTKVFKLDAGAVKLASQKWFNYTADDRNKQEIYAYVTNKLFSPQLSTDVVHICTAEDIAYEYVGVKCVSDHKHCWWIPGRMFDNSNSSTCIAWGANNKNYTIHSACHDLEVGDTVLYPPGLDHINVVEYKTISQWHYLKSDTVKQYDLEGNEMATIITDYTYNNEKHIQLSEKTTINSVGDTLKEKMWYPEDFDYEAIENFGTLVANGITAKPVKIASFNNQYQTGGKIIKYNDLGQPLEILNYENKDLIVELPHNTSQITSQPDKYKVKTTLTYDTTTHKVIQTETENGEITSYIWGHNNSKPVAKFINMGHDSIPQAVKSKAHTLDDDNILSNLEEVFEFIRTRLPDDCLVSLYTYDPLIGMTSQTDANGRTTFYEYDEFGRLTTIKDHQGHIVKQMQYNYKQTTP